MMRKTLTKICKACSVLKCHCVCRRFICIQEKFEDTWKIFRSKTLVLAERLPQKNNILAVASCSVFPDVYSEIWRIGALDLTTFLGLLHFSNRNYGDKGKLYYIPKYYGNNGSN